MPRVIWTPSALADVQRMHRFLVGKDSRAARRAIQAIRAGVKLLGRRRGIGRPVDDMEAEFREWPIEFGDSGYLVLYRIDNEVTVILAVRHQNEVGY